MNAKRINYYIAKLFALKIVLAVFAVSALAAETNNVSEQVRGDYNRYPRYITYLMDNDYDLRYPCYPNSDSFADAIKSGRCLYINNGNLSSAQYVTWNRCQTVGILLTNETLHGLYHFNAVLRKFQIKVIQQDRLIQSPWPVTRDPASEAAVLATKLYPGDVVVLCVRPDSA